jgi:hypothetical protein
MVSTVDLGLSATPVIQQQRANLAQGDRSIVYGQVQNYGPISPHPVLSPVRKGGSGSENGSKIGAASPSSRFLIDLVHEGMKIQVEVYEDMPVLELSHMAASIFNLDPHSTILVLFGIQPRTMQQDGLLSDPPVVESGATVMVLNFNQPHRPPSQFEQANHFPASKPDHSGSSGHPFSSKILGNFKIPKFDGSSRHWKAWERSFNRYLAIHQLDHVIDEDFAPTTQSQFSSNKLVYYLIEDAITPGSIASKYFRQAVEWDGNGAYSKIYNGFVFSGPQTATLLLSELVNLRFQADESASGFCLRLQELFEDLEKVPGDSSVVMNETQKIGYLLSGIRPERSLQSVYVNIQQSQIRGGITFEEACADLHHRCEAIRADELLFTPVQGAKKALVTTKGKRLNTPGVAVELGPCLSKGCSEMIKSYLPLCTLHYHQCVSGKTPSVELRENMGVAVYNDTSHSVEYPPTVPSNRIPVPKIERDKKRDKKAAAPNRKLGLVAKSSAASNKVE